MASDKQKLALELELLELEEAEEQAQPTNYLGEGKASAIREQYPSEKFARYAEPIANFGGMLAKTPGIGAGLAGAATAGVEIARQGIQAIGSEPGTPKTFSESGGRIAKAFGRGAAGEIGARGVFGAAGYVGKKSIPTGAQLMKVGAGIDERVGKRVLGEQGRLANALPVEEAGGLYGNAMESVGLNQGPKAAMELMDVSHLGEGGAEKFAWESLKELEAGTLTYQKALVARDMLKNVLSQPKWQNPKVAQNEKFLKEMQGSLDKYLEPYFKEGGASFESARQGYSAAMDKKAFSSWLPQNANKTASVIRGGVGLGLAGSGYASDNPAITAVGLAAMSPRMLGYGIRTIQNPVVKEVTKGTVRLGTQAISNKVLPSSTEELMRKHYEAQK